MAEGDKLEPGSEGVKKTASEAMQRHHDHYVRLDREGVLPEEDKPNLNLAKQREKEGLVKPLVDKPEAPTPQPDSGSN